ncbi:MAG TPA: CoA-acylating methylmalonate-semialdehyde dehydrogenase [Rhodospirillales bacterium]|jgi:malonate-semialdehyde dehydrogenase (acetylating)/methylmalonate-semialdehyde dehydrogenase|nr:CoA-acylating methylmalonate-semialdehyde dehydrogenase [Rhodospirillales bacterium]
MPSELYHFIDGKRVAGTSGRFADVFNPATGEVTARTPLASADKVAQAILSAAQAAPGWAATPAAKRARVMFKFRDLVINETVALAEIVSSEHGKTLADAEGEIARGIEVVEFACGIPHLLKGEYSQNVATGIDCYSLRQPIGVCAGITPFNFPAMVPMWMYPVAIACGNAFLLKPSEKNPSVALRLAELAIEAGLPEGVLNVLGGDKEAVDAILAAPEIGAVSFVGSTAVGQNIYQTGAANGKRVQALCGAKNHLLVMPDADMEQTADALIGAGYGSAGERCMAVSVAVAVGDGTADKLVKKLAPRVRALKVAPYTDAAAEMGPIISRQGKERILAAIEAGIVAGAELLVDGRELSLQGYENGFFLGGCLFDRVTPEMNIYRDEIFGPVLSIVRVRDYEAAIGLINGHQYGNGGAIFTGDGGAASDFASRADTGMVGINVPIPVPVAYFSFGGWKRSLFGDHHMHGMEGVRFYTRLKTVSARWPSAAGAGPEFHFKAGGGD